LWYLACGISACQNALLVMLLLVMPRQSPSILQTTAAPKEPRSLLVCSAMCHSLPAQLPSTWLHCQTPMVRIKPACSATDGCQTCYPAHICFSRRTTSHQGCGVCSFTHSIGPCLWWSDGQGTHTNPWWAAKPLGSRPLQ
jgi:hypothetical protein